MASDTHAIPALVDYDMLFLQSPNAKVIPCGESNSVSKNQAKEHMQELFQDGARELNWIASCECGHMVGNYYEELVCPQCKTKVQTNFAENLDFRAWLEIPDFKQPDGTILIPPILHPVAFDVLDRWIGKYKSRSLLGAILNPDGELPPALEGVIGQGYTWFYNNFDDFLNYFLTVYPTSRKRTQNIPEFIKAYRHILFIRHIPILNQSLHLLTSSGSMTYSDDSASAILRTKIALSSMIYLFQNAPVGPSFIDQRMWDMYQAYTEYCSSIKAVKLLSKTGYIRKCILGSRFHCSYRAVIVPLTEIAMGDELHLPWLIGVVELHHEIINVLMHRRGNTLPEALAKHAKALAAYDAEIDEIMEILISECPYKGAPQLFGRNPTLQLGAIQLLFATKIKKNYEDQTIGINPTILKACNADFDGDCLYGSWLKEMAEIPKYMVIHPLATMLGGNEPGISGMVKITPQTTIGLNEWLNDPDQFDENKELIIA